MFVYVSGITQKKEVWSTIIPCSCFQSGFTLVNYGVLNFLGLEQKKEFA